MRTDKPAYPHLIGPRRLLVHDRPLVHRCDGFERCWTIAQCTLWSLSIVVMSPLFDDDLCFPQGVEALCVEQFISEPAIEAFTISIVPRRTWLDVCSLCTHSCNPVSDSLSNELGAIV